MKTRQRRDFDYLNQDPETSTDNKTEKKIFTLFRDNYLLPEMQCKVGPYYLDFGFPKWNIGVEFFGPMHIENRDRDEKRLKYLIGQEWAMIVVRPIHNGYLIFVYTDQDVLDDAVIYQATLEETVDFICNEIIKPVAPKQ